MIDLYCVRCDKRIMLARKNRLYCSSTCRSYAYFNRKVERAIKAFIARARQGGNITEDIELIKDARYIDA